MRPADPNIEQVLGEFLTESSERAKTDRLQQSEAIVDLLISYLDGYAYEFLSREEEEFWRARLEEDEEANSYCRTFGPDKILPAVGLFLGWYVIRKVAGPAWIVKAAGPVISDLVDWLRDHGYAGEDDVTEVKERAVEASRDLPGADRLGSILYDETEKEPSGRILEDKDLDDELITITRVEPETIWFETEEGEAIGPVRVPAEASDLAQVGWGISATHFVRTAAGWHLAEIGNVYPGPLS